MSKYDFDVIVMGGGSAGLSSAGMAAHAGAKTMMIEKNRLGGDCTWTGCVPSKTLLKAGKVAQNIREAGKYGLIDGSPEIDFKKVIAHVQTIRQDIYEDADSPEKFEDMGVEVVSGEASFTDKHSIDIKLQNGDRRKVSSRYFFICTGASAIIPPVKGIESVNYLTNETLFEIAQLPKELIVVGAGPVGTEMAQAMNRLGSKVTVIDMADRIMVNDDPELAAILRESLEAEGIRFELGAQVTHITEGNGRVRVLIEANGGEKEIVGTKILIAAGRRANISGLNLEAAGVNYSEQGITVNEKCRSSASHVYACGDVTGEYQLTHMSEHMAKVAATNALLKLPMKMDRKNVPWVTFTDPELGHVGATEEYLKEEGISYETYRFPYSKIDRALTESKGEGMIKIYAKKWSGKILGADIVGENAGEMISEYAVAMKNGVTLRNLADTIHPYPTYALGARRAADQWYIKNQSEWQVKLIKKVFGYRGEVPDLSDPDRVV